MKDKISNLQWTKKFAGRYYPAAVSFCDDLTHDGQSDWRLPTIYELQDGAVHGMTSVASTHWISSADMDTAFWSSTSTADDDGVAAWSLRPLKNTIDRPWKFATDQNVVCVRP